MPNIDPDVLEARFQDYRNVLMRFGRALVMPHDEEMIYLDASAHRFILAYELTWKALKRLLRVRGVKVNSPAQVFREAYAEGWIVATEREAFEKMMDDRNLVTHEYFEEKAKEIYVRLPGYHKAMVAVKDRLETMIANGEFN